MEAGAKERRFTAHEFHLPDGRKVVASTPQDLDELRRLRASNGSAEQDVELVVQGSAQHEDYLQQTCEYHESRREQLRQQHGSHFDEWEDCQERLSTAKSHLRRLSTATATASLGNIGSFGYNPRVRTYDEGAKDGGSAEKGAKGDEDPARDDIRLFKKPVMRQWFHRGLVWRRSGSTEIKAIEIFFDLVYAGIIHDNGVRMTAEPSGRMLLRFVITFLMSWRIWTDVTNCLSWFETKDILTRFEVLFQIGCLLGFTTNIYHCLDRVPDHNTYPQLVTFYLAARLFTALYYASVAVMLPSVRGAMIAGIIEILIPSAIWMASVHIRMPLRLAMIWPALLMDMYGHLFCIVVMPWARGSGGDTRLGALFSRWFEFYPCPNIEHKVARARAFVGLVSGYSVVGILFQSAGGYTVNAFLGKAILGMVQAYFFNWIYFDLDSQSIHLHAYRRSTITAFLWDTSHLIAIMGYIVAASALAALTLAHDVPNAELTQLSRTFRPSSIAHILPGSRWLYCCGLAVALGFMGVISLVHVHRRPEGERCRKAWRLSNRAVVCVVLVLLPLARSLTSLDLQSISVVLVGWVLGFELWGRTIKGQSFIGD